MTITCFPIRPTEAANFEELRKTLVLMRGISCVEIYPDHIDVSYDPDKTDLARVRKLIEHKGYATDEPSAH